MAWPLRILNSNTYDILRWYFFIWVIRMRYRRLPLAPENAWAYAQRMKLYIAEHISIPPLRTHDKFWYLGENSHQARNTEEWDFRAASFYLAAPLNIYRAYTYLHFQGKIFEDFESTLATTIILILLAKAPIRRCTPLTAPPLARMRCHTTAYYDEGIWSFPLFTKD